MNGNIPINKNIGSRRIRRRIACQIQIRTLQLIRQSLAAVPVSTSKKKRGGGEREEGTNWSGIFSRQIVFVSCGTKFDISVAM